ncbi:mono/diheme cytochrome c family protein/glucose/arabinose dehydrogenase [Pedobacter africanus]|uniref:Mono/diheme cytochrome c family protein/glucose/arabinose dehydrogenase n=1 Tax=Pedobacter africanus TaxID=151894 RepID=A0ACC6KR39_9SPHI|nr:c-type cytochrome [Pedobacter africanus]MDR6781813.1 mono/diheme cytochrome c family protein/glucose/arabinose dehydrogenase [Pedobacter africanus]
MKLYIYIALAALVFTLYQCQTYKKTNTNVAGSKVVPDTTGSPVINAAEAINLMKVEEGFEVKLVAAEPLVAAPVALTFDDRGRIWVVEMMGYMPDVYGKGEDKPNGKIVILEDKNGDGVADERKVFLDSLVLPRAICLIDGGILVAESPNLWYYEIHNDKPGKRILVDGKYADEGNVEHQPNGLLRAMDNWIYNAKSTKRYRKKGAQWIIEETHFRGQWGISQDDYGRLYYNDNSTNLMSDYFSPGYGATNPHQRTVEGFSERTVKDNRVYPARPTPGVNRGYMPGTLDDSLRLRNFTAACGPVIYRGDLFGDDYRFNAFVAEPSANLIKRDILNEKGLVVSGKQAYQGKEFLASTDERFRPVSLYNGLDGALYVVDMYRGIIQHKTYVTPYLKSVIERRKLSEPLGCGRIYKVVPKNKTAAKVNFNRDPKSLVALLGHTNGQVRDMAQQILIDSHHKAAVPYLREAIRNGKPLQVMHAVWVLEGLSALETNAVLTLLKSESWPVRMQALSVLPSVINGSSYPYYVKALRELVSQSDARTAAYIAFAAHYIRPFDGAAAQHLLMELVKKYPDDAYVASAVLSNLAYREEGAAEEVLALKPDTNLTVNKQLKSLVNRIRSSRKNQDPLMLAKEFPKGAALFASSCQTCHATDGNGIKSLAPPLNKSEWVTGNKEKLISIVLYGLTGPVKINGYVYEAPEISADMPGIAHSEEISDEDVAQVLSFIRGSWQNNAAKISAAEVAKVRQKLKGRQKAFTIEELGVD